MDAETSFNSYIQVLRIDNLMHNFKNSIKIKRTKMVSNKIMEKSSSNLINTVKKCIF